MAGKNDGGDKTEKPTPRRLQDARKKGDVPKSKDVTSTVGVVVWLVVLAFGGTYAGSKISSLFDSSFAAVAEGRSFDIALPALGWAAISTFLLLTAIALIPAAAIGTLSEFLQAGGVLSFEKLKPTLDKMNPVEGFKRMFSLDNLVELIKTVIKALLIVLVTWAVLQAALPDIVATLPVQAMPTYVGVGRDAANGALQLTGDLAVQLFGWTLGVFLLVAVLDMSYQRYSYTKKLRMSLRDIRDEVKENEGDPHIRASRKQLHQEWANQNAIGAARNANVLIVNPTHLALALDYDPDGCPVPVLAAKGEGPLAQAMREAAEEAGVPIIRNVDVARRLYEHGTVEDVIPQDMFEAIAEIILWAKQERDALAERRR